MKKYFLYIEFFLIFAFFIAPPIFQQVIFSNENLQNTQNFQNQIFITDNFQFLFSSILIFSLSSFLFYQFEFFYNEKKFYKQDKLKFFLTLGKIFLYFGFLIFVYSILFLINFLIDLKNINFIDLKNISLNWKKIILIELNFLLSAFYEENLYRLFLPNSILEFSKKIKEKIFVKNKNLTLSESQKKFELKISKIIIFIIEFFCNLIFAFSHFYLGIAGVINAFISGAILRFCAKKNHTILIGTFAHFFYNSFIFILAFLI